MASDTTVSDSGRSSPLPDGQKTAAKGGSWIQKNKTLVIIGVLVLVVIIYFFMRNSNSSGSSSSGNSASGVSPTDLANALGNIPQGPAGPAGPAGAAGPAGPPGPKGPPGPPQKKPPPKKHHPHPDNSAVMHNRPLMRQNAQAAPPMHRPLPRNVAP